MTSLGAPLLLDRELQLMAHEQASWNHASDRESSLSPDESLSLQGDGLLSDGASASSSGSGVVTYASLSSATVTLAISAAGAGMLSFSYACMVMGILATVVCTLLFASLNAYTLHTLCRLCHMHGSRMVGHSYEELVSLSLGMRAYKFCLATILIGSIGALTGYLLIMASLGHGVLWNLCTHSDPTTGVLVNACGFWSSRTAVVLILCIGVILPISFCRSLHDLAFSTWISFLTILTVMIAVAYRGMEAFSSSSNGETYPHTAAQATVETTSGLWINLAARFFLGWPIILFSLGCHLQLPLVFFEVTPAVRQKAMTRKVVPTMTVVVVLLYLVTGLSGFVNFGSKTEGNILLNYKADDMLANVAKALMALHITLAFPVCLFPSRAALDYFGRNFYGIQPSSRNSLIQSLVIISISATLAVLIPQVQTVFGLLGSTIAVSQTYLFPGLMLLATPNKLEKQNKWDWDHRAGWAMVVWSAITCVLGTTATLVDMIDK